MNFLVNSRKTPVFTTEAFLFIFSFFFIPNHAAVASSGKSLSAYNLLSWASTNSRIFGCMLEKEFGSRDPKYNCSTKQVNVGGLCGSDKDAENYYAGPEFTQKALQRIKKIIPDIEAIELTWEHAELQNLTVTFNKIMTKHEIEKSLKIKLDAKPENIQSIYIQEYDRRLTIKGFDHMGGADVDCTIR